MAEKKIGSAFLVMLFFLFACGQKNEKRLFVPPPPEKTVDTVTYHTNYIVDTAVDRVEIDGRYFSFTFAGLTNPVFDTDQLPLNKLFRVIVRDSKNRQCGLLETNDNHYHLFKMYGKTLHDPGKMFLCLISSGGGSGFGGELYYPHIVNDSDVAFDSICGYSEMTMLAFDAEADHILAMNAIWNFDEQEVHFSDHRYDVALLEFQNGEYRVTSEGVTKKKYLADFYEDSDFDGFLGGMVRKEPQVFKGIAPSHFRCWKGDLDDEPDFVF